MARNFAAGGPKVTAIRILQRTTDSVIPESVIDPLSGLDRSEELRKCVENMLAEKRLTSVQIELLDQIIRHAYFAGRCQD